MTKFLFSKVWFLILPLFVVSHSNGAEPVKILNFQGDSGFQHDSKDEALSMVEWLGKRNGWTVISSADPNMISADGLREIDVVIFNNNCGTDRRIFTEDQHKALQSYVRGGGGFVGIHCAGAIWHEGGEFQTWYEKLIGTRLVAHPHVQNAKLVVERQCHQCTAHLPKEWIVRDEWHKFSYNPREHVNVLISLDEDSYEGKESLKMGGDHPFTWYQYYDGGRSFFTSLGHTEAVYHDANFQRLVEGGIRWAAGRAANPHVSIDPKIPVDGLIVDLNADHGVTADDDNLVSRWTNQVADFPAQEFVIHDYGIRLQKPGSGKPTWEKHVEALHGHGAVVFREDELINMQEDAFDHLITGSGYTWIAVLKPDVTPPSHEKTEFEMERLQDVNAFLGNLRNGGNYEGFWGCLDDDLTAWCGTRNGVTFGRFDDNNPKVSGAILRSDHYSVVAATMGQGTGSVPLSIFINQASPSASGKVPVNPDANPSKLAIGTERDATNHPGTESFDGAIARILLYERPLSEEEMQDAMEALTRIYGIDHSE